MFKYYSYIYTMEFKVGDRVSHTYKDFISDGTIIDAYFHKGVNSNMFHVEFDNGTFICNFFGAKFWMQSGEIKKNKQQKREERLNELGL